MADEDEWKKLSTEEKVQHKVWKARAEGYKECIQKFPKYDEKSPEFGKYLGLMKKFVTDSNELNRIQGLQAALVFVENASAAGKTCGEVLSGLIAKCFNTKPRLREMGIDLCLMYVEIDKNELVQDEMMKAFDNKQPKIVHACLDVIIKALSLFGSKVISVKPLIKQTTKLLDHRDKNVRDAVKALFVEIYRWIGPAIRAPLHNINAVVLKELEDEWEKVGPGGQSKQTRFMRSQQDLREKMEAKEAEAMDTGGGDAYAEEVHEVDPYDLLEPVEILSKLPKTFYTQIEEKKWQERKAALEACEKLLTENPKLAPDDYADFVKALKKVLSKDTNIMLVTIAIKCIGTLATGLRKKFQPYALVCLEGMFERFKEKKPNVVAALQEAVDAIYLTTSIQAVSESVVEALGHKNPSIRGQVGLFLTRALTKTKSAAINKALMKIFVQPLCKNMDHSSPDVREAAFQATGTMLKLVGEKKLQPFLADLDKLKMDKINDCAGKASVGSSKGGSADPATSKPAAKQPAPENKAKPPSKTKPLAREKKSSSDVKIVKGGKKPKASKSSASSTSVGPPPEAELSDEDADDLVAKVITGEERTQILNNNWKERLAGLQSTAQKLKLLERSDIHCQAFVKLLTIKPGWKDNNFNCMIEKFKLLAYLAESGTFSRTSATICLLPTVDKIGDAKAGGPAKDALSAIAEAVGMPWVAEQVIEHSMAQKNPKIQSVALSWLSQSVLEFGMTGLNMKMIIEKIKFALAATNPAVRTSALTLIGSLTLFMGEKLRMFFENEKSALLQQIDAEMQKVKGQTPPAPTRGIRKQSDLEEEEAGEEEVEQGGGFNFDDMVTRVDISGKITDSLIGQINDKNWKLRKEGLETVVEILNEAKFISADLGDLPGALKARLSDSNKLLITTTLNLLSQLSTALGPHSAKHLSTLSSSIVNVLGDSKPQVRQTGIKCMNTWLENSKLSIWLEGDMIASALSNSKQSFMRIELLNWLSEKLPTVSKLPPSAREGLELCIPRVYSCCEDRSGEVRAKAQAFLPAMMRHLSFDKMVRATGKLGASSKTTVMTMLEKVREQMPPPAAKASKTSLKSSASSVQSDPAPEPPAQNKQAQPSKEKRAPAKKEDAKKRAPSAQRKAKVEEDTTPMFLNLPNGKEQRMKDEAKLKTIKWTFTTPREELVTQLQQQLATCIGSTLLGEMFHADFQHHLKAISMLSQGMSSDWNSTVNCLDVLLRWFTLRFYDKNTTVHIKSLEYLKSLFDKLIESDYRMSDYEVFAFLPHLIIKVGESKDNIRKAVHWIIKQISLVYPASKVFNYIMDGIKSKNSRQRSECLDEIGLLIETHGVVVCQPTAAKALKEVAANIGDRDKGVRSSALNAIVAAYNVSGDIIFKQVGRLNEKDMSMLEERIKRSGKFTEQSAPRIQEQPPTVAKPTKTIKETKSMPTNMAKQSGPTVDKSNTLSSMRELHSSSQPADDGPLIPEHITRGISQLQQINVDHLLDPLPVPEFIKEHDQGTLLSSSTNASATLDLVISQVSSPQLDTSITAIHELYEVLKHKEKLPLLKEKMDQLLTSSTTQVRMTSDRYLPLIVSTDKSVDGDGNINEANFKSLCKSHFAFLLEVFDYNVLASQASAYALFDFLRAVLQLMINDQFRLLSYTSKLTQILNMLVLRMFEHCDPTAIMCAILKTLGDSLDGGSSAYVDLAVKCIWKIGRLIPQFLSPKEVNGFTHQPLKVASTLAELDRCWSTFPRGHATYVRLNNDVPLRSMKTILMIICKQPNVNIMEELHMISNPEASETVSTIQKFVGSSASKIPHPSLSDKKENIGSVTGVSLESKLSSIFKKIGDRQLTKQGLRDLYQFKLDHPYYDVDPQIEGLEVEFFRDYVKRGLKKIEEEKRSNGVDINGKPKTIRPSTAQPSMSRQEHLERLNKLRTTCGLEPLKRSEASNKHGIDPFKPASLEAGNKVLASTTNSLNQIEPPVPRPGIKASRSDTSTVVSSNSNARAPSNSTSLLDLKRRLEEIKQNSARR